MEIKQEIKQLNLRNLYNEQKDKVRWKLIKALTLQEMPGVNEFCYLDGILRNFTEFRDKLRRNSAGHPRYTTVVNTTYLEWF